MAEEGRIFVINVVIVIDVVSVINVVIVVDVGNKKISLRRLPKRDGWEYFTGVIVLTALACMLGRCRAARSSCHPVIR